MDKLLKFLIFNLDTANGQRGTGLALERIMGKHLLMRKTMLKYKIMRIRYKISFHALIARNTVS